MVPKGPGKEGCIPEEVGSGRPRSLASAGLGKAPVSKSPSWRWGLTDAQNVTPSKEFVVLSNNK